MYAIWKLFSEKHILNIYFLYTFLTLFIFFFQIETSEKLIVTSQEAIEYYQTYHKNELLVALCLTMFGWIFILIQEVFSTKSKVVTIRQKLRNKIHILLFASFLAIGLIIFNICMFKYDYFLAIRNVLTFLLLFVVQKTPPIVIIYFLTPIITWVVIVLNYRSLRNIFSSRTNAIIFGICFLIGVECHVRTYYRNYTIILPLIIFHVILPFLHF